MDHEQQLFLIEFLVDKVSIPVVRAIHEELLPATTCVSFQVLSLPPINICQDTQVDGCGCNDGDVQLFKKGKSCLFALPSIVLQKPLATFPITISVYKKLPPGVLPDVMLIGSHKFEAKDLMNALLSQYIFKYANPCQAVKDSFKITTATGQCVGALSVFIRASCFGKKIVTQFQIPHNRKPYLFKGADDSPVFQCKKIPSRCYVPEPLKCNCPGKCDGSGEAAGRTCCPTPSPPAPMPLPMRYKQPDWGARPCCPSRQTGKSACSPCSPCPPQQVAPSGNCPPCCPPRPPACCSPCPPPVADGKCAPPPVQDGCPPCCAQPIGSVAHREPPVKKCGCAVKDYSCNCNQKR